MATETAIPNEVIEKIARDILKLETLEARNSDSLDFSDQAVEVIASPTCK